MGGSNMVKISRGSGLTGSGKGHPPTMGVTGPGGAVTITGGASVATNGAGGAVSATGGAGIGTGAGGASSLVGGTGGVTSGVGGAVNITGGVAGTGSGANGGAIVITAGTKDGAGTTGILSIQGFTLGTAASAAIDVTHAPTGCTNTKYLPCTIGAQAGFLLFIHA